VDSFTFYLLSFTFSSASSGSYRVLRGGGWGYVAQDARSAYRNSYNPYYRSYYLGFRLVRP